jgi:hypothetical protein
LKFGQPNKKKPSNSSQQVVECCWFESQRSS